jgi:uncharacterized protein CbrC (UPF0167 family)
MSAGLPVFRYHPDPVATGSIVVAAGECVACRRVRGYLYTGPVSGPDGLDDGLCPWCIADGTAAERFDASFADVGSGVPADVPQAVIDEIAQRTPSYLSWQQDYWLYHCADACAFLGLAGRKELQLHPPQALAAVVACVREYGWPDGEVHAFVESLDRDGQPTAYLFRCLRCDAYQAHCDFT